MGRVHFKVADCGTISPHHEFTSNRPVVGSGKAVAVAEVAIKGF